MNSNIIYNLNDKMPFKHIFLYGVQELLAILVATLLITSICGVPSGAGMIGAGLATLIYILITKGNSNVYVSNSGAYVAPCIFAFAAGGPIAAAIGAVVVGAIYILFGLIFDKFSIDAMYKFLPKPLVASITILIGLSLIGFVPTYLEGSGIWGTIVALLVAGIIAIVMYYGKGKISTLPFLIAVSIGYVICALLTLTGVAQLIDFSVFNGIKFIQVPSFNFMRFTSIDTATIISVVIMYTAYSFSGVCEIIADHHAMSVVLDYDLSKHNGIKRIFYAMGGANCISGLVSGIPVTSYGEGTGCTATSRVANARVTAMASILLILMGFCGPIQALMMSIPSCVFAGASLVLYPMIAVAGFKMLIHNQINLDNSKNMILVAIPISIGLGGLVIGGTTFALSGTALALIAGIILNLILKEKGDANA